ncbi:hypothetical protein ABPG75_007042 [Micractinium tetrahymenae]
MEVPRSRCSAPLRLSYLPDECLVLVFGCLSITERRADWDDDSLEDEPEKLAEEETVTAELPPGLAGFLGVACAAGHLRELSLVVGNVQVHLGPWLLPAASTLRSLHLHQDCIDLALSAAAPLHRLTALQELHLSVDSADLLIERGCRLPSQSLTLLRLGTENSGDSHPHLPPQVSTLSALRTLRLDGTFAPTGFEALAGLPSLRCLCMHDCLALPHCLSELASLQELSICQVRVLSFQPPQEVQRQAVADSLPFLSEGLAELRRLTSLLLDVSNTLPISTLPADLGASLPLLRRFAWRGTHEDEGALPVGLTSLRAAVLPAAVAGRSLAQLAAAPGLEHLALWDSGFAPVLRVVRQLPSLRRLQPSLSGPDLQHVVTAVQGLAPALVVEPFNPRQWWVD